VFIVNKALPKLFKTTWLLHSKHREVLIILKLQNNTNAGEGLMVKRLNVVMTKYVKNLMTLIQISCSIRGLGHVYE
jgi:hypothetical protein